MINIEKLLSVGFVIAVVGFSVGTLFDQRQIGAAIFLFGFVLAAIAIVGAQLKMPSLGMKVGAIGFALSVFSVVPRFYIKDSIFLHYLFYVGVAVVLIGIIIMIFNISKKQKNE